MTESPAGALDGAPGSRTFMPAWLSPADVKEWLRLHEQDDSDDALILRSCAATEAHVQRCRPEFLVTTTSPDGATLATYEPDAEAYQGGVMYAAREYRRRNSPAGIEAFGDVTSFVSRFDPDIDRALRTGSFMPPALG